MIRIPVALAVTLEALLPDGGFCYDGAAARRWLDVIPEWRRQADAREPT
ncbi:MAG: hypothetical protein PVH00_03990 [Gemmatimonadota bacterium]|jgi:hypothetical protein